MFHPPSRCSHRIESPAPVTAVKSGRSRPSVTASGSGCSLGLKSGRLRSEEGRNKLLLPTHRPQGRPHRPGQALIGHDVESLLETRLHTEDGRRRSTAR